MIPDAGWFPSSGITMELVEKRMTVSMIDTTIYRKTVYSQIAGDIVTGPVQAFQIDMLPFNCNTGCGFLRKSLPSILQINHPPNITSGIQI